MPGYLLSLGCSLVMHHGWSPSFNLLHGESTRGRKHTPCNFYNTNSHCACAPRIMAKTGALPTMATVERVRHEDDVVADVSAPKAHQFRFDGKDGGATAGAAASATAGNTRNL